MKPFTARLPDIAGQGIANPLAFIMSSVMMLNYIADEKRDSECGKVADAIRQGYNACLREGFKTGDLGGELSTAQFTEELIKRLGKED